MPKFFYVKIYNYVSVKVNNLLDCRYSKFTETVINFFYIAGRYCQIIKFYNVEEICKNEIAHFKELFAEEQNRETFSIGKFYTFNHYE